VRTLRGGKPQVGRAATAKEGSCDADGLEGF